MMKILMTIITIISIIKGVNAEKITFQNLIIQNAWIKDAPINHPTTSGYLTIQNKGEIDDTLINVSSSIASKTEIHQIKMEEEIIKMRPLSDGLIIPAGSTVDLKPGSFHLMFINLKTQMIPAQTHPINLTFLHAGTIAINAVVNHSKNINQSHSEKHAH